MEAARVGLLDTAMKTADIGTVSRKTSKVLENFYVNYESAVINTAGIYSSLSYGEGYSCSNLIRVTSFKSTGEVYMPFDLTKILDEIDPED